MVVVEHRPDHERLAAAVAPDRAEQVRALALEHLEVAMGAVDRLPLSGSSLHGAFGALRGAHAAVANIPIEEVQKWRT